MTAAERKKVLRARALERRLAKSEETRRQDSRAVCALVENSGIFADADCLLLYAPVRGEMDMTPLADAAVPRGITVGYPCVSGDGHMTYRAVKDGKTLVSGAYGIPAPDKDAPEICPTEKTLLLIPALMGDADGYRLGYGGGYFDRFLPSFPGIGVLILSADEVVPCLPTEENDIPVSCLVTPAGWRRGI